MIITKKPQLFSKSQINKAGDILRCLDSNDEDINKALEVLSDWRAQHNYPMSVFKNRLKRTSESLDETAFCTQRLKRVSSIIKKLNRQEHDPTGPMKLSRMQDIAGCRAVMKDVSLVRRLYKNYYKDNLKHEKINEKDYITYPKPDGYRSLHIIYKYFSDKNENYGGSLVEVQIRSKLQHIWATAVETTSFFTNQALKLNEGQENWKNFFKLVSSAFAIMENCPLVPGTPSNKNELYNKIKEQEDILDVRDKLIKWSHSVKAIDSLKANNKNAHLFLLQLDTNLERLHITVYTKRQKEQAVQDYINMEKKIYDKPGYDVVLVGADKFSDLKKAYPNYFLDTKEFLKYLDKILKK